LQIEDFWDEGNPYYHKPEDTIAAMNLNYWEEQIKATLVTAAHLAVPVAAKSKVYMPVIIKAYYWR